MALSVFGPGIVLDRNSRPVAATVATVTDPNGAPLETFAVDGVTPQPVVTDANGVFDQFSADPGTETYALVTLRGVTLAIDPVGNDGAQGPAGPPGAAVATSASSSTVLANRELGTDGTIIALGDGGTSFGSLSDARKFPTLSQADARYEVRGRDVDPHSYGAPTDGSSSAAAALQSALTAAAASGAAVVLRPITYQAGTTPLIVGGSGLIGSGKEKSKIVGALSMTDATGATIEHLTIEAPVGATANTLTLTGSHRCRVADLAVTAAPTKSAIVVWSASSAKGVHFNTFEDIEVVAAGAANGVYVSHDTGGWVTANTFRNVFVRGDDTTNIVRGFVLDGVDVSDNLLLQTYVQHADTCYDIRGKRTKLIGAYAEYGGTGYYIAADNLYAFGAEHSSTTTPWTFASGASHVILGRDAPNRISIPLDDALQVKVADKQFYIEHTGYKRVSLATEFNFGRVFAVKNETDGVDLLAIDAGGIATVADVKLSGATTGTTAPAAGGAGALPATPAGYVTVSINGTARKIPYY